MSHARIDIWILECFSGSACMHNSRVTYRWIRQDWLFFGGGGVKIKEALLANELGDVVLIFS